MLTRIHYRLNGRQQQADVAAAPADAPAVFAHAYGPRCVILRVEVLGEMAAVTGTPGAKPTAGLPPLRPITANERVEHRQRLAALRAQLARLPVPTPKRRHPSAP